VLAGCEGQIFDPLDGDAGAVTSIDPPVSPQVRPEPEPEPDAGAAPDVDAGTPPEVDAGATPPELDGGTAPPGVDAGAAPPDAGAPPQATDAGRPPAADAGPTPDAGPPPSGSALWVSGYYPGWTHASLRPADIDFRALSHLVDFSLHPLAAGTLEDTHGILGTSAATISAAHAAGVRVLVCVGGANTAAGFRSATGTATLDAFVNAIVSTVTQYGYDGVDLDWEPLGSSDATQYRALVTALHARLAALAPRAQLTAAVDSWAASVVAPVAGSFDQVNLMTYDMGSPGASGVTWFNSPLSGGNQRKPSGALLPAADLSVQSYRGAGLPASKLGIGIAFYGDLWSGGAGTSTGGVSAPVQSWTTAPAMAAIDYRAIIASYYQPARYHLDPVTGSAWLGIDLPGSADDRFIAYEDEASIALKLAWVKAQGLGGVIIWQLAGGWISTAPAGQRDPLLQAVRANR